MTVARKGLVDASVTPYYHCISRCVRKAFLCGDHVAHRKGWIAERLQELSAIFAINVCGYSIMDNHLHVLLRLDVSTAAALSDVEIAESWLTLCPPRGLRSERKVKAAGCIPILAKCLCDCMDAGRSRGR